MSTSTRGVGNAEKVSSSSPAAANGKNSVAWRVGELFFLTIAAYVGIFWILPRTTSFLLSKPCAIVPLAYMTFKTGKDFYQNQDVTNFLSVALFAAACVGSFFAHPIPICIVFSLMVLREVLHALKDWGTHPRDQNKLIVLVTELLAVSLFCFNSAEVFTLLFLTIALVVLVTTVKTVVQEKAISQDTQHLIMGAIILTMLFFYFKDSFSSGVQLREWVLQLKDMLHELILG